MKTLTFDSLTPFARAYLVCALWTFDNEAPSGDYESSGRVEELSRLFHEGTLESAANDCAAFTRDARNAARIEAAGLTEEQAGHDFWLSRNGHGSGFFDRCDHNSPDSVAKACRELQADARRWGESDLYRGDDGLLYLS